MWWFLVRVLDSVPRLRVEHHLKLPPGLLQRLDEAQGMIDVDVVVNGSMKDQQLSLERAGGFDDGTR